MCRSKSAGGRRCPYHSTGSNNAKATRAAVLEAGYLGVSASDLKAILKKDMAYQNDPSNPEFVSSWVRLSDGEIDDFIRQQEESIMSNTDLTKEQKRHAVNSWHTVTYMTEQFRRAFNRVMTAVREKRWGKTFAALVMASSITFAAAACSSDSTPTHYRTPKPPGQEQAASAKASATAAQNKYPQYGGVDPATVTVPDSITSQYGEAQAKTIAASTLAAVVAGLGDTNAYKVGGKTQRDFTVLQNHETSEAWNSTSNQDDLQYDANGLLQGKGNRIAESLTTVTNDDGTITLADGKKMLVKSTRYSVGDPIINETITNGDLAANNAGDGVQVDFTYKVTFAGTVDGKTAEEKVTYTCPTSVVVVPSGVDNNWVVADAVQATPTASAVTAF